VEITRRVQRLQVITILWMGLEAAASLASAWIARSPALLAFGVFALAAYVAVASALTLLGYSEARPAYLGVAILLAAVFVMPWLAKEKRKLSAATGSAALRVDAAQASLCAYLSLIALAGLAVNAIWRIAGRIPSQLSRRCPSLCGKREKPSAASRVNVTNCRTMACE